MHQDGIPFVGKLAYSPDVKSGRFAGQQANSTGKEIVDAEVG